MDADCGAAGAVATGAGNFARIASADPATFFKRELIA